MCNPFEAAGTTYGQYGNFGPTSDVFGAPQAPKSGPNHEKMWALCSTIITWPRKITKTVLAFKNRHGLDITRLGLPSTMCYNQQWSVVSLINKMVKINNQSLQASISLTNQIKITKKSKKFNI